MAVGILIKKLGAYVAPSGVGIKVKKLGAYVPIDASLKIKVNDLYVDAVSFEILNSSKFYAPLTHSLALTRGTGVATFTRNSIATVMGYAPTANSGDEQVVLNCGVNEARFQGARRISEGVWSNTYANGTPIHQADLLGYLSEGARKNGILQSQAFDDAAWTKRGTLTITPNATTAPDGTLTADMLTGLFTIPSGDMFNSNYSTASVYGNEVELAPSVWVKKITQTGTFNMSHPAGASTNGDWQVDLNLLDDGWNRITKDSPAVTVVAPFISTSSGQGGILFYAASSVDLYLWGAQLEQGVFASSYIPTTTVAVTRAEDVLTYPKAGNLLDAEGTVYAECGKVFDNFSRVIGDGGNSAVTVLAAFPVGASQIYDGTNSVINEFTNLDTNKLASKWSGSSMATTGNGDTVDSTAYIGALNLPNGIGIGTGGDIPPYSPIREVYIWDIALTDAELIEITE